MIDWPGIHHALKSCFEQSTGLPFVWENEAHEFLQAPYGVLNIGQSSAPWRDDVYTVFEDVEPITYLIGARDITLTVQVFSRSHLPHENARHYLEKARTALRKPATAKLLKGAGLILLETHPLVELDFSFDQRKESRAAFEVVFRTQEIERDVPSSDGFFDHVDLRYCAWAVQ